MNTYLYPQNLKATATLWLWSLRDFAIIGISALLSVVILAQAGFMLPLVFTLIYAFLSIQIEETTMKDYIRYAVKFFISTQQYFIWK